MTLQQAGVKWKLKKNKLKQLEKICYDNPDLFIRNGEIDIPVEGHRIHLPDKRFRGKDARYLWIINAVISQQRLIPSSVDTTWRAQEAYLDELIQAKLIRSIEMTYGPPKETTDCIETLKLAEWEHMKSKEKYRLISDMIHAFVPDVNVRMQ